MGWECYPHVDARWRGINNHDWPQRRALSFPRVCRAICAYIIVPATDLYRSLSVHSSLTQLYSDTPASDVEYITSTPDLAPTITLSQSDGITWARGWWFSITSTTLISLSMLRHPSKVSRATPAAALFDRFEIIFLKVKTGRFLLRREVESRLWSF